MWIWILAALLLLITWVGGYFFPAALLLKVAITVLILFALCLWLITRRLLARRAARKLEQQILKQAEQQALAATADRRGEILALQTQLRKGIDALKGSKLGAGGGNSALYALPWYMIIGPAGAGKTTALRHSGLGFPTLDPSGEASIKGVGGTRNCDWWFTNEAVLLDTAGRYASDQGDHEEWQAFLGFLRKYRPRKPLNGLIVAISVSELAEADEKKIAQMGKRLRERVDEVMAGLQMVLPVYLVFTKADLVAGFSEFCSDLRRSERGQIWGATFELGGTGKAEPGKEFDREFSELVRTLHSRAIQRVGSERDRSIRQRVLQFPVEFQALGPRLSDFVSSLFSISPIADRPIFRGFYFTSGTQEGRPADRVIGEMAQAFHLDMPIDAPAPKEPKSYFVTDLFRKVIFAEQNVAGRSPAEARRRLLSNAAFAIIALLVASGLVLPASCSFMSNRGLVAQSLQMSADGAKLRWPGNGDAGDRLAELDLLRDRLVDLQGWRKSGAPMRMGWMMYSGDAIYEAFRGVYVFDLLALMSGTRPELQHRLQQIMVTPGHYSAQFARQYDDLKLYLMLCEPGHTDAAWGGPKLGALWASLIGPLPAAQASSVNAHATTFLSLVADKEVAPWKADTRLVEQSRERLLQVPQLDRMYEALVSEPNAEVPAIRRETIFRGSVVPYVLSRQNLKVDGAYTKAGWSKVRELLGVEQHKLTAERWVLGDGASKAQSQADVEREVAQLREIYFERYRNAWRDFSLDLDVQKPDSTDEALDELSALSEPEWPYARLVRTLSENVTLEITPEEAGIEEKNLIERVTDIAKGQLGLSDAGAPTIGELTAKPKRAMSPVEKAFKPILAFGVPPQPDGKDKKEPDFTSIGLGQYQTLIAKLVGLLTDIRDAQPQADPKQVAEEFQNAFRSASTILANQDGFTRPILSPLLMNPITLAWAGVLHDSGGAASGLWEVSVWSRWNQTLANTYPFADSPRDAQLADFTAFFKPQTGLLWAFYEQNLKGTLEHTGGSFVPMRRFKSTMAYAPDFLSACLKRGLDITNSAFPPKSEVPQVQFEINLHSVSENVAEVTLAIDGAERTYKNEPQEWLLVQWPAKEPKEHGASVRIRGYSGLDEQISRPGDFGLFRLLDIADIRPGKAGGKNDGEATMVATWKLRAEQGAVVKIDIRPSKSENPLSKGFFGGYSCPRVITQPSK